MTALNAFERFLDKLRADGRHVRTRGDRQAVAQCPAHEDRDPSLSVRRTEDRTLVHCHAGCHTEDVLGALNLTVRDLYDNPRETTYHYTDTLGEVLRTVHRRPSTKDGKPVYKAFRQSGDTKGTAPLYRLPDVAAAVDAGIVVYLVEGEEDVHTLAELGAIATSAPAGAKNFAKVDVSPLEGAAVVAVVDADAAGEKWAATVAGLVGPVAESLTFVRAAAGKDASDHVAAGHGLDDLTPIEAPVVAQDATGEPAPRIWRATDLEPVSQPTWLAAGRIPRSAVTILVGDEGIGKSLLWVWAIAAVTTGQALPEFGIPERDAGRVLLVLTEDEWSSTVRPRLEVAGADLTMIDVIATEADGSGSPIFPRDMHLVVTATPAPALVIVDAFLDTVTAGLTMKDPQQARQALHPWKEAATVTGAAVMLLTHTNRVDSKNARDRYGITGELRKKARMTLYAQQDEDGNLVVGPEKSNIVGKVAASKFTIRPEQFFPASVDHDGTVPKLVYLGESDLTAAEHLRESWDDEHGDPAGDRTEAEQWLEDFLAEQGKTSSKDVKAGAKKVGIAERTLKRASKFLGVRIESEEFPRVTYWSLPDSQASQDTPEPHVSERGPTGPTGNDLHKHPGPTAQLGQSGQPERHGPTGGTTARPTCEACGNVLYLGRCVRCEVERRAS